MAEIEIEIEIPPYFLCPISLDIMRDPVTVSTGITYERESIEKWVFTQKKASCPATKQHLDNLELTPNITLRRLIQSWCTLHATHGVQRLPTPKAPLTRPHLLHILSQASRPHLQSQALQTLKSIASDNLTNKRCMAAAGVPEFLAALIVTKSSSHDQLSDFQKTSEDALSIIYALQLPESALKPLCTAAFVEALTLIMQIGSYESQSYAIMLLKSMLEVADPSLLITLKPEFFSEIVKILKAEDISRKGRKSALKVLMAACPWGRNRMKAVEAGVVAVVIDLLLDTSEKRACEMMLTVVDMVCQCADGRSELLGHAAGLAVVSKKILRVSQGASERAVRILHSVSRFSATAAVLAEMMQSGVVAKLCLVMQVDCGAKTKEKAREILKAHARAWRTSPCIPYNLISSYPS
ncbi:E3 ubiquitin-protein ligase PUB23-like [Salvia miltiorrhiza]|uniref:E3 ubiquitin-protein ligase PUB23-like n=1 Tax=Salvia miltiorrhiza TaxID=226208 RepID=UPI0025AD8EE8|nr:E3 ubiquitin-protein ligase PUB23-like [Salvia miltiorrhiza]